MTRVCLVGAADVELRYELLSRETAREALSTYDLRAPYANTLELETVSLGAAVALLNDLNWYLVRFVEEAMVMVPSVSETEWLSRRLATAIRDDEIAPSDSGRFLKVYGVVSGDETDETPGEDSTATTSGTDSPGDESSEDTQSGETAPDEESGDDAAQATRPSAGGPLPRLVEPMLVTRTGETLPEYDLRPVDDTLRVRVTKAEFET